MLTLRVLDRVLHDLTSGYGCGQGHGNGKGQDKGKARSERMLTWRVWCPWRAP